MALQRLLIFATIAASSASVVTPVAIATIIQEDGLPHHGHTPGRPALYKEPPWPGYF